MQDITQQIKGCLDVLSSEVPWRLGGYLIGVLHTPYRDHRVTYHPGYGVCCTSLVTTNGSIDFLVYCLPEGTTFAACQMLGGE